MVKKHIKNHHRSYMLFVFVQNSTALGVQLAECMTLTWLQFGKDFNQPIKALAACTNLTHLEFGRNFNQPIEEISASAMLTHLKFGWSS